MNNEGIKGKGQTKKLAEAAEALAGVEKIAHQKNIKTVSQINGTTHRIEKYCLFISFLLVGIIASQVYELSTTVKQFKKQTVVEAHKNSKRNYKTTQILQKIHNELLHMRGHKPDPS
tara:strand:- start:26 stop:376 length:351 start_codon:yes stop_codon:yes gene_type:complete